MSDLRMFAYVVTEPVEQPSYYGPTQSIRCEAERYAKASHG